MLLGKWYDSSGNANMEMAVHTPKSRQRSGVWATTLGFVGLTVFLGCSSRSGSPGKIGGTSAVQGRGGNSAAGGNPVTASSASGGAAATGGGATGGSTFDDSASGGAVVMTGGDGTGGVAMGGIPSVTGGSSGGGQAGATTATGGGSAGGAAAGGIFTSVGGSSARGGTSGGNTAGLSGGATATGGQALGGSAAGGSTVSLTKESEGLLTSAGLTLVSYGGYLNGESFQQDGIVSYNGYQYAAFWNTSRHVVLARRTLPTGVWSTIEFTDYTNSEGDAHNTISIGICPGDGTLHLSFDHHGSNLHYRKSVAGIVGGSATAPWTAASFSAVTSSLVGSTVVIQLTYPRFVSEPSGNKMLFEARIGSSGSGDEYLWEYDSSTHAWSSIGMFVNGTIDSINAYPHGLSYTKGGARLHMSWCWRDTPDASTNHDLLYIYSDDHGRTWKNDAGTSVASSGSTFVTKNSPGIKVWSINQNRGLINQEHMAVDPLGRIHVLLSHMPDSQADDATFDSARTKSQFFDYWKNTSGIWTRTALGLPVVANFRGKLAIASSNNVYAVLPDLRIAGTSVASNFSTWFVLGTADAGRFFSDPLVDTARLAAEDKLSIFYPQKNSSNISILDYSLK